MSEHMCTSRQAGRVGGGGERLHLHCAYVPVQTEVHLRNTQTGLVYEQVGSVPNKGRAGAPLDCRNVTAVPEGHRSYISGLTECGAGAVAG